MLNPFRKPSEPLLNILFDGVVNADHFMSKQLLRDHYHRPNPPLPKATALDDWKAVPELIKIAENFKLEDTIKWSRNNWNELASRTGIELHQTQRRQRVRSAIRALGVEYGLDSWRHGQHYLGQ